MTKTCVWRGCTAFALALMSLLSWAQPVSLNLKNADIRSVIDMVSGITGKNFIVDPRVKGKVTLVSSTPVEPDEVYDIFLSIMKVHGYVALEEGGIVNILPANEGIRGAPLGSRTGNDSQMQIRVVPVRNVKAAQLVSVLKPLVSKNGHLSAHTSSNTLVVSDTRRRLQRLVEIIRHLDVQEDSGLEAVKLKHAAASQVIKTLQPLLTSGGKSKSSVFGEGIAAGDIKLAADDRSNTILMTGSKQVRRRLRTLVDQMDTPMAHQGETRVVYLKFAKAVDLAEVLRNTLAEKYQGSGKDRKNREATERQVSIQADEDMNALLITAGPDQHAEIQAVIQALDVRRAQVLVESLIVEMSDDKARSLGIQWLAGHEDLVQLSGANALAATALQQGNLVGLMKAGKGLNIGVLARALANDGDANIISTPSLITLDNAEAEINVGREVPFVTGSYTSAGGSSGADNPFTTIQRNDVGLTMKITPQINQGSTIRLDIDQEISNLLPGAAAQFGASDLVTSKRSIKTSVVVEDGNILVLGGLVDDTLRESQVKVPVLGDVPVLGQLFNYREATKEKRNLMIFIRPKILRDAESSRTLSEQRYTGIRNQQLEQYQAGSGLLSRDDIPLLRSSPNDDVSSAAEQVRPLSSRQTRRQQAGHKRHSASERSESRRPIIYRQIVPTGQSETKSASWQENQIPRRLSVPDTGQVRPSSSRQTPPQQTEHERDAASERPESRRPVMYRRTMPAAIPDPVPVGQPETQSASLQERQIPRRLSVPDTGLADRVDMTTGSSGARIDQSPQSATETSPPASARQQLLRPPAAKQTSFEKAQRHLLQGLSRATPSSVNTTVGISVPDPQKKEAGALNPFNPDE